jgi:excisionase family DNA binding protein
MPPKRPETALISIPEAARRLRKNPRTIRSAVAQKQIASVPLGSRRWIPASEIERLTGGDGK